MTDAAPALMVVAAAALIGRDGRVLVQQRPVGTPLAGLWEFPGGKLEAGETPDAALVREVAEELAIDVEASACTPVAFVSGQAGDRPLLLLLYLVRTWRGTPVATGSAVLRWVTIAEMADLAMPPADGPLVAALARHFDRAPA